jgi:hypothetical protein
MVLTIQLKDTDWLKVLKNKIQLIHVYKKLTSLAKIHTDSKWKDTKWYSKQN